MNKFLKSFILCGLALMYSCGKEKVNEAPFEPSFFVPAQINKINTAGNNYTISVEATDDVSWEATVQAGNDWITLVSSSGKGDGAVVFNLKANENEEPRSLSVRFTASSDRSAAPIPSLVCVITQIGSGPAIEIYPYNEATVSSLSHSDYTITVTANVEWTASIEYIEGPEDWIEITSTLPVTGEGELLLDIMLNPDGEAREAVVSIVSTDANLALIQTITIIQSANIPFIDISPANRTSIQALANNDFMISVLSNISWEVSIVIDDNDEANWVGIVSPTESILGSGDVILAITANNFGAVRRATLHIKSVADPDNKSLNKTLVITQIHSGAIFEISIANYTAFETGAAVMNISPFPTGGASQNVTVDVVADDNGAIVTFPDALPEGDYLINSFTFGGSRVINVGAVFTTDAVGLIEAMEHWDTNFNIFGGTYESRPITIETSADLIVLRNAVNSGNNYAGLFIKQTDDISLAGEWEPIANTSANIFAGIYDGDNRKISNLFITSGTLKALFGHIGGVDYDKVAAIKNLTVEGAGGEGADITGSGAATIAGIVASVAANSLIENCINRAHLTAPGESYIGGVAATCTGDNITIRGCKNYGSIAGAGGFNGGIAASMTSAANENIYVTNCHNYANLEINSTASSRSGGIIGRTVLDPARSEDTRAEIKWCSNRGDINLNGVNSSSGTGGIVGALLGNSVIRECYNLGNINTFTNTGGIAGFVNHASNKSQIMNCYNKGRIIFATRTAVNNGGISGNATNYWTIPIEYCYNAGATHPTPETADRYGAIVGANTIPGDLLTAFSGVKECYYESGLGYSGGLGGNVTPGDVPGRAESKSQSEMKTVIPYTSNWNTSIWQFTAGEYPTLKNNPE